MLQNRKMPPIKASLKSFKIFSENDFRAYKEAEAELEKQRFKEIEESLVIKDGIFFNIEILLRDNSSKNIGRKIFSYIEFESLIQARMVSKIWYSFLEHERELWITTLRKRLHFLKQAPP